MITKNIRTKYLSIFVFQTRVKPFELHGFNIHLSFILFLHYFSTQ